VAMRPRSKSDLEGVREQLTSMGEVHGSEIDSGQQCGLEMSHKGPPQLPHDVLQHTDSAESMIPTLQKLSLAIVGAADGESVNGDCVG